MTKSTFIVPISIFIGCVPGEKNSVFLLNILLLAYSITFSFTLLNNFFL